MRRKNITPILNPFPFAVAFLLSIVIVGWAADIVKFTSPLNRGYAKISDAGALTLTSKYCFQKVTWKGEGYPEPFPEEAPLVFYFNDYAMALVDGFLFLRGSLYQNQSSFPGSYKYKNTSGTVVASLTDNGNLYIKGSLVTSSACTSPSWEESTIWSDGGSIVEENNCYNYANNQITYTLAQPGRASGYPEWHDTPRSDMCVAKVRERAVADGLEYKPTATAAYNCSGGKYLVFMAVCWGEDYHWYRKDSNGQWSHKRGDQEPENFDANHNPITDPSTANRNYGPTENYSDPGGFYCTCGNNAKVR
jgi:hypothetical protein